MKLEIGSVVAPALTSPLRGRPQAGGPALRPPLRGAAQALAMAEVAGASGIAASGFGGCAEAPPMPRAGRLGIGAEVEVTKDAKVDAAAGTVG